MNKESLSKAESNNGNDWNESMADVQPSGNIDFEQRKREIEALKLDIEKAKLEEEKKRAEEAASMAGTVWDPKRKEQDRAERIADSRMYAEESAYRQLEHNNPSEIAHRYEFQAGRDNIGDKLAVKESLIMGKGKEGNTATINDTNNALNGLANRQSERYSNYQDAAGKHIDNALGGIDRKLDILEKHNPNNSSAA